MGWVFEKMVVDPLLSTESVIWVAELPKAFRVLLTPGTVFFLHHTAPRQPL